METMEKNKDKKDMKATVIENVKGSELPASWLQKTKEASGQKVTIILKPEKEAISNEDFLKSMREISAEVKAKGMTPKILDENPKEQ